MRVFLISCAILLAKDLRWQEEIAAAKSLASSLPGTKPAVEKCLGIAQGYEESQETRRFQAQQDYSVCLSSLSPHTGRFLSRSGGLGKIAQDILGPKAFLEMLRKTQAPPQDRAGLLSMTAEVFYNNGDYENAAKAASAALRLNSNDQAAFAVLKLSQGRGPKAHLADFSSPNSATISISKVDELHRTSQPQAHLLRKRKSAAPPPLIPVQLSPTHPNFWNQQLIAPVLAKSDQNPISKKYLSPRLRDGNVRFRLEPLGVDGPWGYYHLKTGQIGFNIDKINVDLSQYNAHNANKGVAAIAPLSISSTLNQDQLNYFIRQYMPMILHESGAHGTNSDDLRSLLDTDSSPNSLDTEVFGWRMHILYIETERRKDPNYLTENTWWARNNRRAVNVWKESRIANRPEEFKKFVRSIKAYENLPEFLASDDTRKKQVENLNLLQNYCRHKYDPIKCTSAINDLRKLLGGKFYKLHAQLHKNRNNARVRAELVNQLWHDVIVYYRLDAKGARVGMNYYNFKLSELDMMERRTAPMNFREQVESLLP